MVQVHATKHAFERPDPTRIAALSGAMTLNFAGLFLLLIPIVMPSAPARVEEPAFEVIWPEIVELKPVPPIPTAPTVPQRPHQVVQPPPMPTPQTTTTVVSTTPAETTVTIETPPVDTTPVEYPSGPIEAGALATIVATPPRYPMTVLRAGIEGTVYLRILVGTDGRPLRVEVDRSSGNRVLDAEAKRHVLKKWLFQPALQDGVPVQAWGRVPIVFSLARG